MLCSGQGCHAASQTRRNSDPAGGLLIAKEQGASARGVYNLYLGSGALGTPLFAGCDAWGKKAQLR